MCGCGGGLARAGPAGPGVCGAVESVGTPDRASTFAKANLRTRLSSGGDRKGRVPGSGFARLCLALRGPPPPPPRGPPTTPPPRLETKTSKARTVPSAASCVVAPMRCRPSYARVAACPTSFCATASAMKSTTAGSASALPLKYFSVVIRSSDTPPLSRPFLKSSTISPRPMR